MNKENCALKLVDEITLYNAIYGMKTPNELLASGLADHRPTTHWVFSYQKLHYTV